MEMEMEEEGMKRSMRWRGRRWRRRICEGEGVKEEKEGRRRRIVKENLGRIMSEGEGAGGEEEKEKEKLSR